MPSLRKKNGRCDVICNVDVRHIVLHGINQLHVHVIYSLVVFLNEFLNTVHCDIKIYTHKFSDESNDYCSLLLLYICPRTSGRPIINNKHLVNFKNPFYKCIKHLDNGTEY